MKYKEYDMSGSYYINQEKEKNVEKGKTDCRLLLEEDQKNATTSNIDMEQAVLGTFLLVDFGGDLPPGVDQLRASDFYLDTHQVIFKTMRLLWEEGSPLDLVTVTSSLKENDLLEKADGAEYVARLTTIKPVRDTKVLENYCKVIQCHSVLRSLACQYITDGITLIN